MYTGPNTVNDGLVFGYDTGYGVADNDNATRFYPGESTDNKLRLFTSHTLSNPSNIYRCTVTEQNIVDVTAPNGQYSRYTGIDGSDNNQVFYSYAGSGFNYTGQTITYSVYLKGSGTCHLTTYDNASGYGTSGTITLTNEWVRYSYTRSVSSSASSHWSGVRGILSSTDVYVAASQMEIKGHVTPFTPTTRADTASLIDLKKTTNIDVSNVSFDSTGQPTFDGTDDSISLADNFDLNDHFVAGENFTIEVVVKMNESASQNGGVICNQKYQSETDPAGFGLVIRSANQYALNLTNSTPTSYEHIAPIPFNVNSYHHIAYTFNSSTGNVVSYSNGSQYSNVTNSSYSWNIPTDSTRTYIGYNTQGGWSNYIDMDIPVAKIYSKALTATEIKQNYNAYKNRFNI